MRKIFLTFFIMLCFFIPTQALYAASCASSGGAEGQLLVTHLLWNYDQKTKSLVIEAHLQNVTGKFLRGPGIIVVALDPQGKEIARSWTRTIESSLKPGSTAVAKLVLRLPVCPDEVRVSTFNGAGGT